MSASEADVTAGLQKPLAPAAAPALDAPAAAPALDPIDAELQRRKLADKFLDEEMIKRGLLDPDVESSPLPLPKSKTRIFDPDEAAFRMGQGEPSPFMETVEPPEFLIKAAQTGVLANKPAPAGHFLASLGLSDDDKLEAYRLALSDKAGQPIAVRMGPDTGKLEFYDKDSGRFSLAHPPGISVHDIEGFAGAAIVFGPEITGAIGGGLLFKHPIAVEMGSGFGAMLGEITRLQLGRSMGINKNVTDDQIVMEGLKQGGISVASGVIFNKAIKLGKGLLDMMEGRLFNDQAAEILELDIRQSQEVMDDVNALLETTRFKLNLAQATGDEDLLAAQELFKRSPQFAKEFRAFNEVQEASLREYFDIINRPYRSFLSEQDAGRKFVDIAQGGVERETMRANEFVRMKAAETDVLMRSIETTPYQSLGPMLRDIGDVEQQAFRKWSRAAAEAMDATTGRAEFIPNNETFAFVSKLSEQAQDAIIPMVRRHNETLIGRLPAETDEALEGPVADLLADVGPEATEKQISSLEKIFDPEAKFSFGQAWEAISTLKRIARTASKGLSTDDPAAGQAKALAQALENDLKAGMNNTPMSYEYETFQRRYAIEKSRLDRGTVGKIMERPQGRWTIEDERVFDNFITPGSARPAEEMHALIANDPEALDAVRRGILDKWQKTVVVRDPVTRRQSVNLDHHEAFMEDFGPAMNVFMNKEELRLMADPATATRALVAREAHRRVALEKINATTGAKLASLNPNKIVPLLFDRKNPQFALDVAESLKRSPEVLRAVQAAARKEVGERIAGQYKNGERFFSSANLDTFLNGKAGEAGYRNNIKSIFGETYLSQLDTLNNAVKLASREAQFPNRSNTSFTSDMVKNLARAYVGLFTRAGRMITAADRFRGRAANRFLARAIMHPEDLNRFMQLRDIPLEDQRVQAFIGAMGGTALFNDFDPEPQDTQ